MERTIRVAFCAHDGAGELGGVATWMGNLVPALAETGVDVRVYAFERQPGQQMLLERLVKDDIPIHRISHFLPFKERTRWLRERLIRDEIQILIPNYFLTAFAAVKSLPSLRTIAVLHSDDALYRRIIMEVKRGNRDFPCSAMVAVSSLLEKMARTELPERLPVLQIPYGVPRAMEIAKIPERTLRLVYVGRIEQAQKRIVDTVVSACDLIDRLKDVEFDFIGDGPKLEYCVNLVQRRGLIERIRFLGKKTPDEVRKLLPSYHSFVLLSDYEGLPVALLEAMSAGLVPVCTRIRSGVMEVIRNDQNGLLVDDRTDSLYKAISRLKFEAGLWTALSQSALKDSQDFSLEVCKQRWLNLFRELLTKVPAIINAPLRYYLPPRRYNEFKWDDNRRPPYVRQIASHLQRRISFISGLLFKE